MTDAMSQTGQRMHFARGFSLGERVVVLILAAGSLAGLVIARVWPVASVDSGAPTCLMRIVTGLPCPGCGMTRSWVHLAHGDVAAAFQYNLFGPVAMAMAAGIVVYTVVALLRRGRPERLLEVVNPKILLGLVGVWLAYSVIRIVSLSMGQDFFALVLS